MSEIFHVRVQTISYHLKNIFLSGELSENQATQIKFEKLDNQAVRKPAYYNLDAIISVGYLVNSVQATQFRIWATSVLREHLLRGYTIKQPASMEQLRELRDELDEVLERQSKMDAFVYEEFGKVYELLTEIIKQKKIEAKPRKRIGFRTSASGMQD
ncbi:MAG: virulence RhuM family protein [Prevotellaceae bacterium]|jgi:hypothetical protein|nr:virulence RhuM family protein [Prevotellaceae bacterium]